MESVMITEELDISAVEQFADGYFLADVELERVKSGSSTYVYRIRHKGTVCYLRVLQEDASFAAEAKAHKIMLEYGVSLPESLYFEHKNEAIGKSIMLTSEIPGKCISGNEDDAPQILFEAGKQLAVINSIGVVGFAWIDRSIYNTLAGEKPTFREYYYDALYSDIDALGQYGFDIKSIRGMLNDAFEMLDSSDSRLVHGDFDNTHIYQRSIETACAFLRALACFRVNFSKQIFKNASQHLRINRQFNIVGGVLVYGETIAFQNAEQRLDA
jgi:hypothetical protein